VYVGIGVDFRHELPLERRTTPTSSTSRSKSSTPIALAGDASR